MAQGTCDDEDWLCPIGSEDEVTKGCLAKGYFQDIDKGYLAKYYFQDEDKGCEASARTQVYLSKTKLKLQVGI